MAMVRTFEVMLVQTLINSVEFCYFVHCHILVKYPTLSVSVCPPLMTSEPSGSNLLQRLCI
jgi:hypothetical protein